MTFEHFVNKHGMIVPDYYSKTTSSIGLVTQLLEIDNSFHMILAICGSLQNFQNLLIA